MLFIIVPVHNAEKTLERCVCSLLNQTYKDICIVLVENGSADNSYEICLKLAAEDRRVKVLRSGCGVSKARNTGLDFAKSSDAEYFAFVDSDDYVCTDMYRTLICKSQESDSDIVFCEYNKITDKGVFPQREFDLLQKLKSKKVNAFFDHKNPVMGAVWRSVFAKNLIDNRFDEDVYIAEDLLYMVRALQAARNVEVVDEYFYNYVIGYTSIGAKYGGKSVVNNAAAFYIALEKVLDPVEYGDLLKTERFTAYCHCIWTYIKGNKDYRRKIRAFRKSESFTVLFHKGDYKVFCRYCNIMERLSAILIKYRLYFVIKIRFWINNSKNKQHTNTGKAI